MNDLGLGLGYPLSPIPWCLASSLLPVEPLQAWPPDPRAHNLPALIPVARQPRNWEVDWEAVCSGHLSWPWASPPSWDGRIWA